MIPRRVPRPAETTRPLSGVAASRSRGAYEAVARMIGKRAGNRALGTWLARQVPGGGGGGAGGGGGGGRRVIVLDGNILDEIHRGNAAIATRLRELSTTADVYIADQAYDEKITNRDIPRMATADRLILDELRIRRAPPPDPQVVADLTSRNTFAGNKKVLSDKDLKVAAGARALNGEVWSVDGSFADNTNSVRNKLGVRVAPESETIRGLAHPKPAQDYRVGLRLVTGDEFEISLRGVVVRRTPGGGVPGGGGTGGGGGPATPTRTATPTKTATPPPSTKPSTTSTDTAPADSSPSTTTPAKATTPPVKPPGKPPVDEVERSRRNARAKFLAGEAIEALNKLFNWIIDRQNRSAIESAYAANVAGWDQTMKMDPTQGLLIPLRFERTQEGVSERFDGLGGAVQGRNEAEARKKWDNTPRYEGAKYHFQFHYIEPLDPQGVAPDDWEPYAVGKFADVSKIRFQRVKFARVGGLGLKSQTDTTDWSPKRATAEAFRFTILRPPTELAYAYGASPARGHSSKKLTVEMRQVAGHGWGGRNVPALIIDGEPIIAVVARDSATEQMFRMNAAYKEIDDKEWSVDAGVRAVRWLRLDQVQALDLVDEDAQREQAEEDAMMEAAKDPRNRPSFGGPQQTPASDPDDLEWDRINGRWRQKKKTKATR